MRPSLWTAASNGPIVLPPDDIWVWRTTMEWYIDRGKPKNSERNLSQCHFVRHKSLYGLTQARTRASAVGGRRLTVWAMARPSQVLTPHGPICRYHPYLKAGISSNNLKMRFLPCWQNLAVSLHVTKYRMFHLKRNRNYSSTRNLW
jgi:hypothetical protein